MKNKMLMLVLLVFSLTSVTAAASSTTNVQFVNHIQANLPEQDVFVVLNASAPNQVFRVEANDIKDTAVLKKMAYATSSATPHDPFKLGSNPLGPFVRGAALGFTLEQWLEAAGSGTYTVDGDSAEMKFTLQKLVPNGVYTVWCSRLTFPPNFNVVDTPCGAPDGSQNVLKADAQGNAAYELKLKPLPESTKETTSLIALAYHSDGKTYGADPGDFGLKSHVQIFFLIPPPKPSEGYTLHIDAQKHFPTNPDRIAHHYCKAVAGGLIECQLYDSDRPDAKLVGVETIVDAKTYNTFSEDEKALWHYHKTEISKVNATLPEMSPQEAAEFVKSIEETYGKVYVLWDPDRSELPIGEPEVHILDSAPKTPAFELLLAIAAVLIAVLFRRRR